MPRVLFIGQKPDTVDFTDPAIPPGMNAEKIQAGIETAVRLVRERGWEIDACMISPDVAGETRLQEQLSQVTYDCVVIGAGLRLPPKGLALFERVLNLVHRAAPRAALAFNTRPEDTVEAAARWLGTA